MFEDNQVSDMPIMAGLLGVASKPNPLVDRRFRPVPGGCRCLEQ